MADSSVAQIVAQIRNPSRSELMGPTWVVRILVQDGRAQPQAKLDAIADALVEIVISGTPQSNTARSLLVLAARSGPTPYAGALQRFIRIHREARDFATRTGALRDMTSAPNYASALAYLREVAVSTDSTASFAIDALINAVKPDSYWLNPPAARQAAQDILRELYMRDLVREHYAIRAIHSYASVMGWRRG
jgi:hypothetical protein